MRDSSSRFVGFEVDLTNESEFARSVDSREIEAVRILLAKDLLPSHVHFFAQLPLSQSRKPRLVWRTLVVYYIIVFVRVCF